MHKFLDVAIVIARCSQSHQSFGIRFEKKSKSRWVATWAFPIKEASAKREGYGQREIIGVFEFNSSYPGCPYCSSIGLFKCFCGKISCYNGKSSVVACA